MVVLVLAALCRIIKIFFILSLCGCEMAGLIALFRIVYRIAYFICIFYTPYSSTVFSVALQSY